MNTYDGEEKYVQNFETITYKVLAGQPTEMSPFGRPRDRWENNIRMYHKK